MRRTNFSGHGLVRTVALEEEQRLEGADAVGDNAESLETDMIELNEDAANQDAGEAEVAEASDVVEALESLKVVLESANANGGLDRNGAAILAVTTKHLYSRVGIQNHSSVALESFGSTSSRMGATSIALEGIKEQVKKIWDAIVAWLEKGVQWVTDYYFKVFGSAEKMKKRAAALSEKANATKGAVKNKTFDDARLVEALQVGGSIPTSIVSDIAELSKKAGVTFGAGAEGAVKAAETAASGIAADAGTVDSITTPDMSAMLAGMSVVSNPESMGFGVPAEGMELYRSDEGPGGMAVVAFAPKAITKGEAAVDMLSKISIDLGAFNPKAAKPAKATINTLGVADAGKLADAVGKLADELIAFRAKLDKIKKAKKDLAASAKKAGAAAANETDKDKSAYWRGTQKLITATAKIIDKPVVPFSGYCLKVGKASLDLVEQSLKQYA